VRESAVSGTGLFGIELPFNAHSSDLPHSGQLVGKPYIGPITSSVVGHTDIRAGSSCRAIGFMLPGTVLVGKAGSVPLPPAKRRRITPKLILSPPTMIVIPNPAISRDVIPCQAPSTLSLCRTEMIEVLSE
jgi:hypothetical protein